MTNIDICNMALGYINTRPIMSLDEASEPARKCKLYYDQLRKRLLRSYTWGFAKKLATLARLDVPATPNRKYMYTYPNDCITIVALYDKQGNRHINSVEGLTKYETFLLDDNTHVIGCDLEEARLEYIADVKEPDVFSIDFIEALSHLLASTLAVSLVSDPQMQQTEHQLYQIAMHQAMTSEAREREPDHNYPDAYAKARF